MGSTAQQTQSTQRHALSTAAVHGLCRMVTLKPIILNDDWTFVTKNSVDFRGPEDKPGTKGQYANVAIHAGLICLNGPPGMDLDMQIELFEQALLELDVDPDLVNQVLEITLDDDDDLHVLRYALPAEES